MRSHHWYQKISRWVQGDENTEQIAAFVNVLLEDALMREVSDIHFEPQREHMRIRFRMDGILHTICEPHASTSAVIMTHLKVRAHLDIAEKRLPQDGRCRLAYGQRQAVARMNTLPTLFGEKLVLRIFYKKHEALKVDVLGFEPEQERVFMRAIHKPQGLILITGPTGSGKTTTLYTALSILNSATRNITCVEDPVEIELEGVNQLSVNHKYGLSFEIALEALLRQDPDIMVVGEIRNRETAKIVIQAAQTGHLVFSTLHTNSAVESISRLSLLGILDGDVLGSVIMIITQRLMRIFCGACQGVGCTFCLDGYRGQTGIYEYIDFSGKKKQCLSDYAPAQTLRQSAALKVERGLTSVAEVIRVLGFE